MTAARNYARFYALLNRLPTSDREELKAELVSQYTGGRTDSLRGMTAEEYDGMCDAMQRMERGLKAREAHREELRYRRSVCLRLMQRHGIDTTDWGRVDAFCMDPRISGKKFARLSADELEQVAVKLRLIARKQRERDS